MKTESEAALEVALERHRRKVEELRPILEKSQRDREAYFRRRLGLSATQPPFVPEPQTETPATKAALANLQRLSAQIRPLVEKLQRDNEAYLKRRFGLDAIQSKPAPTPSPMFGGLFGGGRGGTPPFVPEIQKNPGARVYAIGDRIFIFKS